MGFTSRIEQSRDREGVTGNFTATAHDGYGRSSTSSVTVNVLGTRSYTYDSNRNLTSDGVRNFAYNDGNQLIGVWVTNGWSNSFAYDGLLRKRIEQDFAWSGNSWVETNEEHYIYDGNLVLQERDKNNRPLTTYTRGVDLSGTLDGAGGIGGLLARSDNQRIVPAILTPATPHPQNVVTSYYFSDGQGNVVALASPSGMVLAQYKYDPFGNLISKGGLMADINKYRFSSKEWEGDAGLYYYGYRFYDPNMQRWLNRDPVQEAGGINLHDFVLNSPPNYFDLLGLDEHPQGGWPPGSSTTSDGPQLPITLPPGNPTNRPPILPPTLPPAPNPPTTPPSFPLIPKAKPPFPSLPPWLHPSYQSFPGPLYGQTFRCLELGFGAPNPPSYPVVPNPWDPPPWAGE